MSSSTPRKSLRARARTLLRQANTGVAAARANFLWDARSQQSVPAALSDWAAEAPDDPILWFEGRRLSVGEFDAQVNQTARAWSTWGVRKGDCVALMMANTPDYLRHMYALFKLGAVAALINPALRQEALVHALTSSQAKALVIDVESQDAARALPNSGRPALFFAGSDADAATLTPFSSLCVDHSGAPIPHAAHLRLGDLAAYVFTSGTTGLPKPALVKHHRLWRAGQVFAGLIRLTCEDTLYCCLPLYHANAAVIAMPAVITHRAQLALSRKFSARRFWRECIESEATSFIYVGELLRYLVNREPSHDERAHQVTRILGNGLAADLWPQVKARFGIERIGEYYAATEGNAETANLFNRDASMGPLLPWKMAVVAWDPHAQQVERNAKGRARRVGPNTPGLLLGKIGVRNEYTGYADKAASQAKVLRDVFKPGDAWFNTGDLVAFDRSLHMRFVDRLGDTFRWKSENVATREVSEALTSCPGVLEACVYGVQVPGHEGRAGMAAIVVDQDFDAQALHDHCVARLPRYALPRFLRLVDTLEVTGTFKHRKLDLQRQGYAAPHDALLLFDPKLASYLPVAVPSEAQLAAL